MQITKKEKFERKFIVFTFATSQLCWVPSSPRLSFSFQHFLFVSFSLSLLLNLLWEFLRAAGLFFFLRLVALLETNTYFLHMKYLFLILYFWPFSMFQYILCCKDISWAFTTRFCPFSSNAPAARPLVFYLLVVWNFLVSSWWFWMGKLG